MTLKERFKSLNTSIFSSRPAVTHPQEGVEGIRDVRDPSHSTSKGLQVLIGTNTSFENNETTYPVDIVFVHGLNGDPVHAWTHENGVCWPKDLLPSAIPGARIYSYGYPSQIFATKSVAGVHDFANHLLDDLGIVRKENQQSRPIIYICHSLGGIVVKQALITAFARKDSHNLWSQCNAVIFMGTPHRGSPYATYGKILGDVANLTMHVALTHRFIGGVRTDLIKTLDKRSPELLGISTQFCLLIKDSPINIISFYETEAHPYTNRTIVDKASAQLGVDREQFKPLFLNHQDLCRFSGPNDINYVKVCDVMKTESLARLEIDNTASSSSNYSYDETEKACASLLNSADVMWYESKLDARVEGTLEWVLRNPQYNEWASSPKVKLLWVTGFAGSGKTTLSSFMSQHLINSSRRTVICKFFCDARLKEYCAPLVLLRSIIFQLVDKRKRHWHLVKKACNAGSFKIFNQFDALWNLFVKIVRVETKYTITVIFDAIDEFNQTDQLKLIARIAGLLSLENSTCVKFFVTSRPNAESALDFESCLPYMVQLPLEESKEHIDADIRLVVHHRLERMVKKGACKPLVRDSLEELLVAKADQTFLWIKFVLPLLESHRLLLSSEADMITSTIPTTLTSLYKRLLMDIPERERDIAAKVLKLLIVCNRPLTGDEIGILLTITPEDRSSSSLTPNQLLLGQESVQALLGPLIRIYNNRIEFVHLSLKEYLITLIDEPQDDITSTFGIDVIRERTFVFRACTLYLSLENLGQECLLLLRPDEDDISDDDETTSSAHSSSHAINLDSYERDLQIGRNMEEDTPANNSTWALIQAKFPLFDYTALHWATDFAHCYSSPTRQDCDRALALCEKGSSEPLHWFRYFWHRQAPLETFPAMADAVMITSYFGHIGNLSLLLQQSDTGNEDSLSQPLYWAARQGHHSCVDLLLKQRLCNPQHSDQRYPTPLSAAAQFGRLMCVFTLLKDPRVDVNTTDGYGRTALSRAVSFNHNDIVNVFLAQEGIDINLQDHAMNTPLHLAVDASSVELFNELLTDKRAEPQRLNKRGRSVLSLAAELGVLDRVASIMCHPSTRVDQRDLRDRTPLSYASQHGHLSVVKRLIETGHTDPLFRDSGGRNAHSWAAACKNSNVLRYLTRKYPQGVDVPDHDDWAPLAWTLDPPGYPNNTQELLRHGHVDLERVGGVHRRTALIWAANYRNSKIASILIQVEGINLDAQDVFARTPLSEAAGNGSVEIVRLLLATGKVDLNSRDRWGQTPLVWAVKGGHLDIVKLLLSTTNVSKEIRNELGETALDIARKLEQEEIMSELTNRAIS